MRISTLAQCALCAMLACSRVAFADTTVFINEIHYDDAGADANEGVEIAGPAGTDLTSWKVVAYNGSNGTNYSTQTLSGAIPSNCGGYGLVSVPISGLQNGSPDGVALIDNTGTVIQFLSYEGAFTANDGPANGVSSTDIGVEESSSGSETDSLQLSGTGTQYSDFTWQTDATATPNACNNNQTFGTAPDIAPAVSTTVPANNATNVALDAAIAITFSEPVTVGSSAASIVCTSGNPYSATISGTGSSYSIDPAPDFEINDTCTVTIAADQVTDLDGTTQDPMAADYSFTFTTTPGDVPPTVVSTAPANGAMGFPDGANLQIMFSEPVMLDDGWFTLDCESTESGGSGSHAGTTSGSGDSYSLNPDLNFSSLEECTWTIIAAHVHDMDGTADAMSADVVVIFHAAADASDYYHDVNTSSSIALEASLHNLIKDHVAYPYSGSGTVTWDILHMADEDPMNSDNIVTIYKNGSQPKSADSNTVNREHTWPNSYGFNDLDTVNSLPYPPYTDCHMLFLSDDHYNSDRGNKFYGTCSGNCTEEATQDTDGFGGGSGDSNYYSATIWEPWDHRKGDLARAILYMAVRYDGGVNANGQLEPDLKVTDDPSKITVTAKGSPLPAGTPAYMGLKTDLLNWNDQDPPDAVEQLRNEVVYSFQDNRNPFVDHPEWARCVFTNTNCPDEIFKNGFEP